MAIHVIAPHISCVVNAPLSDDGEEDLREAIAQRYPEIYIVSPSGLFKHHQLRGEGRYIRLPVTEIPGFQVPTIEPEINFLPEGKIPYRLLNYVEAFFRKVMEVKKGDLEAMIWILWKEGVGYHLHVPDQTISKASVNYGWDTVPEGCSVIVDIHSHNTMGAFFSGTDDRDDNGSIRFSGVFGKLDKDVPETIWRFNYRDRRFQAKLEDIFQDPDAPSIADIPQDAWVYNVKERKFEAKVPNPAASLEVPDSWIDNVKTGYQRQYFGRDFSVGTYLGMNQKNLSRQGSHLKGRMSHPLADDDDESTFIGQSGAGYSFASGKQEGRDQSKKDVSGQGKKTDPAQGIPSGLTGESLEELLELGLQASGIFAFEEDGELTPEDRALASAEAKIASSATGGNTETNSEKVEYAVANLTDSILANHRLDELICNKGWDVAFAFCSISELMADLDGQTDLTKELVSDMALMMPGEERAKLFRTIWETLPEVEKQKVQTNGL